jgi:hypothetical protein
MFQAPNAIVAGPVIALGRVIADYRLEIPATKRVMAHRTTSQFQIHAVTRAGVTLE